MERSSNPPVQFNDQDATLRGAISGANDPNATSTPHNETEQPSHTMPPRGIIAERAVDAEIAAPNGASSDAKPDEIQGLLDDLDESNAANDATDPMAEMRGQLEREMTKRRPDRFMIAVICRALGGIPDEYRSNVWKELLGVARNERLHLDQSILQVEEDLANQRVISADACRTRGNDDFFKQPATVETITKILTFYSKSRNIRYKQGMNEVLAPFLMLEKEPPMPEGVVFQLFYAMIDKFLPHVFVDRDFKSLQCSFQLFRLLMLYHDPMLCNYLDQHAMTPELYVTPWFMTLFARGLPQELVFVLWDFFILNEDPYLLHFVAYALVESHREEILKADVAMLPQVLSNIHLDSRDRVDAVCAAAIQLMDTTPRSFTRDLYSVCYGGYNDAMVPFLRQLMGASSLQVYPDELLSNLLGRLGQANGASPASIASAMPRQTPLSTAELLAQKSFSSERHTSMSSVFLIVLDCRPVEQYRECHLSLSYHIDPDIIVSPDALSVLIKGFRRMKGCHFCFVGPSSAPATTSASQTRGGAFDAITRLTRGMSGERSQLEGVAPQSLGNNSSVLGVGTHSVPFLKKEHLAVTRLVLMFLQKGFEHVSRLDGSFDELKAEMEKLDTFAQDQLLVYEEPVAVSAEDAAGAGPSAAEKAAGGLKLFARKALEKVRTLSDDDMNSAVVPPDAASAKAKAKPIVSTLSQRFQILTSAAKDVMTTASTARSLQSPPPSRGDLGVTEERRLVGEDEWIEVCARTREALEKSLCYKDVVFQAGSLGILFQRSRHKKYLTVVDSLVPESQASESQQVEPGDLLISVNGQDIAGIQFQEVIDLIKDARRPLVLRLQNPKKKPLDTFDTFSIPPLPPIMISASHHSLCVSWTNLAVQQARYQLQFAKQSDYNFNPWVSVPMKQESEIDRTSGITTHHNGTLVGLDPGVSLVFRVRCGNGDKWGPYSLSSGPMSTLEKGIEEEEATQPSNAQDSVTSPTTAAAKNSSAAAVFLPGECPEFFERGTFYFRVVIALRARVTPAFDGEKLDDLVLEKGTVIKCSERLVSPGTNQIFVRLCRDWNVSALAKTKATIKREAESSEHEDSLEASDPESFHAWAFENTPEGACVLERLPEFTEDMVLVSAPPVPLQEQAKSLVSSIFSATGIKSSSASTASSTVSTSSSTASSGSVPQPPAPPQPLVAPRLTSVASSSPTEIVVTWEAPDASLPTKYQVQYAKNRLTAIWWTVKQEIGQDATQCTVSELSANTTYVFRVRAAYGDQQWGPFSDTSEACKTMELEKLSVVKASASQNEATTPTSRRDEGDIIDSAAAAAQTSVEKPSGSSFTSFFGRQTAPAAAPQLRTGSTLLDKAVAAASKLSLPRTDSGSRRRRSSVTPPVLTADELLEAVLPAEGDLIDAVSWKAELEAVDPTSCCFSAVRYIPTLVVTSDPLKPASEIDPFAAIASSKPVTSELIESSETSATQQLTWNRVGDRDLVVTRTTLFALAKPSSHGDAPDAVVETRRSLSSLAKITSKKTVPSSVVFHFRREATEFDSDASPMEQLCFVVEDKATCVALVKKNYTPPTDEA